MSLLFLVIFKSGMLCRRYYEFRRKKKRTLLLIAAATNAVVIAGAADKKKILIDNGSISGRSLADAMLSDITSSYDLSKTWSNSCACYHPCRCKESFKRAAVKNIKHGLHQQKPRKGFNVPR